MIKIVLLRGTLGESTPMFIDMPEDEPEIDDDPDPLHLPIPNNGQVVPFVPPTHKAHDPLRRRPPSSRPQRRPAAVRRGSGIRGRMSRVHG